MQLCRKGTDNYQFTDSSSPFFFSGQHYNRMTKRRQKGIINMYYVLKKQRK